MHYNHLGGSGLKVSEVGFGTATFGGIGDAFQAWGSTDLKEAKQLIALCMDHGVNMFDTANVYSSGRAEEILGAALEGRRADVLISTKASFPTSHNPNDYGASRHSLVRACEASLRRLATDYIDVYYIHGFDETTPVEETLRALDDLTREGKVRYIGCSNFSGWQLMKSLATSDRYGLARYVAHQAYYSLVARELEWELMPLASDQKVGTVVWSALAGGALSGKLGRGRTVPAESRLMRDEFLKGTRSENLYEIVDVLEQIALEIGRTVAQVALRWVLQRPTVVSIVLGARNEMQLEQNLGAIGWCLSEAQIRRLNAVSEFPAAYPYWYQRRHPINGRGERQS